MSQDLITTTPEIILIEKLEETNHTFAPVLFEQMKNQIEVYNQADEKLPPAIIRKKKLILTDFVNKAASLPIETQSGLSPTVVRELNRLHLFSCQQAIYNNEVRHNPFILGFHALSELKTALTAIMLSYRLITPSCPYSWSKEFFQSKILTAKGPDGHTIIDFKAPIPLDAVNTAVTEELVTDWLIYRAHDHNGIKTLMDIKNNLITIPDYKRGGHPADEFSRFERKMAEQRNKKEARKNETLELEFRKTLVKNLADITAEKLLSQGLSAADILNQAFNGNLNELASLADNSASKPAPLASASASKKTPRALPSLKQDTSEVDSLIAQLLEDKS